MQEMMMMTDLITPPSELLDQWCMDATLGNWRDIATQAAQWGADQELEACCEWLDEKTIINGSTALRTSRRPKPLSLKEQALEAQQRMWDGTSNHDDWNLIRRALEQL